LDAIVMKCLEKKPARRFASAGVLAEELRLWLLDEHTVTKHSAVTRRPVIRRRLPVIGGAALAILFVLGLILGPGYLSTSSTPDPGGSQPLDAPVVLIGDEGPPLKSNLIWGPKSAVFPGLPNEPFVFGSKDTSALELMPAVPWESYRFEAELLHDPNQPGEVGLFLGHAHHPTSSRPTRTLVAVGFSDRSPLPLRNNFSVVMCKLGEANDLSCGIAYLPEPDSRMFGPVPQSAIWRRLAVEVTPTEFRVFWQGQQVLDTSRASIDEAGNAHFQAVERTNWQFEPRGGLGIYASSGVKQFQAEASFQRVSIRHLRQAQYVRLAKISNLNRMYLTHRFGVVRVSVASSPQFD
jgi:hypothetical protein